GARLDHMLPLNIFLSVVDAFDAGENQVGIDFGREAIQIVADRCAIQALPVESFVQGQRRQQADVAKVDSSKDGRFQIATRAELESFVKTGSRNPAGPWLHAVVQAKSAVERKPERDRAMDQFLIARLKFRLREFTDDNGVAFCRVLKIFQARN